MNLTKYSKELARVKEEALYSIGHTAVMLIATPNKIKGSEIFTYGNSIDKLDRLGVIKAAIRKGNGHIGKVQILKPRNNSSLPDKVHTVEFAFQSINGMPKHHIDPEDDHVRLVGKTENLIDIFKDVEDISMLAREKTIDFVLTWLELKGGILKYPKTQYQITYSPNGIEIKHGSEGVSVSGAIDLNNTFGGLGTHLSDDFIFMPQHWIVAPLPASK